MKGRNVNIRYPLNHKKSHKFYLHFENSKKHELTIKKLGKYYVKLKYKHKNINIKRTSICSFFPEKFKMSGKIKMQMQIYKYSPNY